MSNLDTRLREALDRVAESTKVNRRVEEIVSARHRRPTPKLVAAVAAFASVVAIFVIPMVLSGPSDGDVAGGVAAPLEPEWIIDPAWLTVESVDLDVFDALTAAAAEVHGPGWRPSFRTEAVWCLHEGGPGADTRASDFPIEEDLSVEALTVECATGNDSVRNLDVPPETLTVCRGVFASTEYQQWLSSGEYSVIAGDIEGTRPGFPVVLGWQSDCVSELLDTTNRVVLSDDLDLDQVNEARQLEIALVGASHNNCFDYEQASALADEAVESLGTSWLRVDFTAVDQDLIDYCYQPVLDLQWGAVYVMGVDEPVAEEPGTSTTLPPG